MALANERKTMRPIFHFGEIGQRLRVNNGIDLLVRFLVLPGMQGLRHETNQSRSAVLVSVHEANTDLGTISG
jgi:hypothetical protein